MKSINYTPLQSQVTFEDLKTYFKTGSRATFVGLLVIFILLVILIVFGSIPMIITAIWHEGEGLAGGIIFLIILLLVFMGIAAAVFYTTRLTIRMKRFATANGFSFINNIRNPNYTGMIFSHGSDRVLTVGYISQGEHGKEIEFGNYQYVIGSGKNRHTVTYGFVRIELSRQLPHIVLDAKSNNMFGRFSNLPSFFDKSQKLSLEGDFDNHFSLYTPKQYERDALYVMTPDIMATLIDGAKAYDLEIVDNQLFIYSSTPFQLHKQTGLEHLFAMTNTIAKDLNEQTDYYADEKVGDRSNNIVAGQGRRLKKSFNWIIILVIAYFVINFVMQIFGWIGN